MAGQFLHQHRAEGAVSPGSRRVENHWPTVLPPVDGGAHPGVRGRPGQDPGRDTQRRLETRHGARREPRRPRPACGRGRRVPELDHQLASRVGRQPRVGPGRVDEMQRDRADPVRPGRFGEGEPARTICRGTAAPATDVPETGLPATGVPAAGVRVACAAVGAASSSPIAAATDAMTRRSTMSSSFHVGDQFTQGGDMRLERVATGRGQRDPGGPAPGMHAFPAAHVALGR